MSENVSLHTCIHAFILFEHMSCCVLFGNFLLVVFVVQFLVLQFLVVQFILLDFLVVQFILRAFAGTEQIMPITP